MDVNLISSSNHVLFCLLYKRHSEDFRRFLKILRILSEGCTNISDHKDFTYSDQSGATAGHIKTRREGTRGEGGGGGGSI